MKKLISINVFLETSKDYLVVSVEGYKPLLQDENLLNKVLDEVKRQIKNRLNGEGW